MAIDLLGPGVVGVGGAMVLKTILDYVLPYEWKPEAKRDAKLQEFQKRHQAETQDFQTQQNEKQRHFQLEMEATRMDFQEKLEMRRLQFQSQMEASREALQQELTDRSINSSREIARFQAIAMRETQILVSRENAQNLLYDHMVQDALKNFPLNISPLVLLKNRPHSLSSLLRFTVSDATEAKRNISAMVNDVQNYTNNPEPLNIFVAPIYVDSKIKNRKILSDQIWDTTYQRIESFFTQHYNRRGDHPVVFYPTAWNDKYSSGMHASETLHFFLRDMPCIVLEPRFDGRNFRLMISAWGIGYTSTEHIRSELNFEMNIDTFLAEAVYNRSKKSKQVLEDVLNIEMSDADRRNFIMQYAATERNIKLYEALRIKDRAEEVDALGVYNIFKIEPIQDLEPIAKMLSAQIGMTLAALADVHHLRSTRVNPLLPMHMKQYFPELFNNKDLKNRLFKSYTDVLTSLGREDRALLNEHERKILGYIISAQEDNIRLGFEISTPDEINSNMENKIRSYVKDEYKYDNCDANFEQVCAFCYNHMNKDDIQFFKEVIPYLKDVNIRKRFERIIEQLEYEA